MCRSRSYVLFTRFRTATRYLKVVAGSVLPFLQADSLASSNCISPRTMYRFKEAPGQTGPTVISI